MQDNPSCVVCGYTSHYSADKHKSCHQVTKKEYDEIVSLYDVQDDRITGETVCMQNPDGFSRMEKILASNPVVDVCWDCEPTYGITYKNECIWFTIR